jgi:hypothetical protein
VGTGYDKSVLTDELRGLLEDGYTFPEVQRQPTRYDLERVTGTPFHWVAEFPEVAEKRGSTHSINFDIVLGNPPYGDLLSDEEKVFVTSYDTESINDISANFVERQLQLLENDGYFGNVTTARLVYQGSIGSVHELLRKQLRDTKMACFGFRPSRVFQNAHVRVALITGQKDGTEDNHPIQTSDFIVFTQQNREEKFQEIGFHETDGLTLSEKIGDESRSNYVVLPKVGSEIKASILEKLSEQSNTILDDLYSREQSDNSHSLFKQRGGLHWINPMMENLRPQSSGVLPFYFEDELEKNLSFLIYNSSLFYVYWLTYGNQHNQDWAHFGAFPYPDAVNVDEFENEINGLAKQLWSEMKARFDSDEEKFEESGLRQLKELIDNVDNLLACFYGLSEEELAYVQNYLTDWDGARSALGLGVNPRHKIDYPVSATCDFDADD